MTSSFVTIAEAVKLTGKSRRTIQRLVQTLAKEQPDQVMQEKTSRGYIWKISEQSVQQAFGETGLPASVSSPVKQSPAPASVATPQSEKYIEVALQGYRGLLAMHQEVKQVYEDRLNEKNQRIAELAQALKHARRGLWGRLLGS